MIIPNVNDAVKLAKIKEVISMTAGINRSRGDGLVVHDIEILDLQKNNIELTTTDESQVNPKQQDTRVSEALIKK